MKRLLSIAVLLGLSGLGINLMAQNRPGSASQQPQSQSPSSSQQSQVDARSQQAARAFEGKITKSGDKLVLQDAATRTSYQIDDQDKAKQFEGKNVKVMATMDPTRRVLL